MKIQFANLRDPIAQLEGISASNSSFSNDQFRKITNRVPKFSCQKMYSSKIAEIISHFLSYSHFFRLFFCNTHSIIILLKNSDFI